MQDKISLVLDLYERLTYHIENEEHSEDALLRRTLEAALSSTSVSLSLTEVHMIAYIGDKANEMPNGTIIAKALNITKGGISKAAAKLINKDMVSAIRSDSNRKEVYYSLTQLGQNIYNAHAQMHGEAKEEQRTTLKKYSESELDTIAKFLRDILA